MYRTKYRSIEIAVGPAFWPALGWAALLVLIQATAAPLLTFRHAVPSLAGIVVVLYAARAGARRGGTLGLCVGLFEDVFAGGGGGWTLATALVGLCVGALSRRMFADGAFVPAFLCGVAMLARDLAFWIVMRLEGYPPGFALAHFHAALWNGVLTAIVAFLYLVVRGRLVVDKTTIHRYV